MYACYKAKLCLLHGEYEMLTHVAGDCPIKSRYAAILEENAEKL
jgi:hypothetical protein